MSDRFSILPTPTSLTALLLLISILVVSTVVAQSFDPKLAIRHTRESNVASAPATIDAIGYGQSVNSWDNRFGYGKSSALNGWGSVLAYDAKGNIYVGGSFTTAGTLSNASNIGYWDGESWTNVGGGLNGPVTSISILGNEVYVGGQFTKAGAYSTSQNVVKWDGSKWISVGNGLPGVVTDVEYYQGSMYVSGWFSNAGNNSASFVARWDGHNWQPLASGVNGWVSAMVVFEGKLIVAGLFTQAGGIVGTRYIAAWDGEEWTPLGNGSNDLMLALSTDGEYLYAGGAFTSVSNVDGTSYIARWDGRNWESLANGLSDWVSSIHVVDNQVAVGGWFKSASNSAGSQVSVNRLATFNTANKMWTSVGNGVSYSVDKETVALSVAQLKGNVYVAGVFNMAGNTASLGFARWIDNSALVYEMPKIVSPSNHTVIYGSSANLTWNAVEGGLGYTVQVSTDSTFKSDVFTASTLQTDYLFNNVSPSLDYYWRVRTDFAAISSNWSPRHQFSRGVVTSLDDETLKPGEFRLLQNYPNPFNPSTTIGYELSEPAHVVITIHSADGRLISTIVNETKTTGSHHALFNAQHVSSGIYLYRMQTQKNVIMRTMTLVK